MNDDVLSLEVSGSTLLAEGVGYDIEHVGVDGGAGQLIRLTLWPEGLSASVHFTIDHAEEFLVGFQDEISRAKQANSETGVAEDPHAEE